MKRLTRMFVAAAGSVMLVGAGANVATAETPSPAPDGVTVIARKLNNPRQISLLEDKQVLLVAEAGTGGKLCEGEGEEAFCLGTTGSIRKVSTSGKWHSKKIVTGLLSGAGPDGSFAVGSDGVSARHLDQIYIQETFFGPDPVPGFPWKQNGSLLRQSPGRRLYKVADITAYETANDPDGQGFDSNPYAVLSLYKRTLVADAAGNSILSVDPKGNVSLFATLPNITGGLCAGLPNDAGTTGCDAVPTSLAEGPDGSIYVGGLGAETPGAGRVWRLDKKTGEVKRIYRDLFTVTGVAVSPNGTVYASELFGGDPAAEVPGQVTKIAKDGTRKSVPVPFPAGLAADGKGRVYVAAFSTAPAAGLGVPGIDTSGQIWRLKI
jgi:hypothetical protein